MVVRRVEKTKSAKRVSVATRPTFYSGKQGRWLSLFLGLTGVAMVSATAGALLAVSLSSTPLMQHKLSPEEASVFSNENMAKVNLKLPELTRPVNILILGVKVLTSDIEDYNGPDHGYHALVNSFKGMSDSMLLLRFDPTKGKFTLLSIPRDTYANVEGRGMTKINAANFYGGPAGSAKSVSELLGGVTIDRYVRINVQAVEKLVDALGGVTIDVPFDMKYQDDSQHLYINLKAGKQHLDGNKLLQFARFRYDKLGDIGRVQRQQMIMRALMEQTVNVKTLTQLPQILSVVQSHIDTNLSIEELFALVNFGTKINRSDVQMLMVPGEFSDPDKYRASYWLPDLEKLDEIVAKYFDIIPAETWDLGDYQPTYLRLAIQNTIDDDAAAESLIETFNNGGYDNVKIDTRSRVEPLEETKIVAQQGDTEAADAIRKFLGFGQVVVESTGSINSDVTVQLGKDWVTRQNQQLSPNTQLELEETNP